MTMPTSMSNQQSASSGASGGSVGGATSDWIVSYGGGGVSSGSGATVPTWVWVAALVLGAVWIKKRGR